MPAADAPTDILEAARKGKPKEIEALLAKGSDIESRDKEGGTPLMLAAQYGRTDSVRLLLEKGAKAGRSRHPPLEQCFMLALLAPSCGWSTRRTMRCSSSATARTPARRHHRQVGAWKGRGRPLHALRGDDANTSASFIPTVLSSGSATFAPTSGRDSSRWYRPTSRQQQGLPETHAKDADGVLTLEVEPGVVCVHQADQIAIGPRQDRIAGEARPLLKRPSAPERNGWPARWRQPETSRAAI